MNLPPQVKERRLQASQGGLHGGEGVEVWGHREQVATLFLSLGELPGAVRTSSAARPTGRMKSSHPAVSRVRETSAEGSGFGAASGKGLKLPRKERWLPHGVAQ